MQDSKKNDGKAKSSVVARPFNTEKFAHLDKDAPITRQKALQISLNAIKSELPLVLPRINNAAKAMDQVNQTIAFVSGLVEAQKKKLNELEIPTLIESIKVFRERVNNVHLDEVEFVKKQIGITVKFKEEDYKGFFWYLILIMDRNDIGPAQASEDYIREIYFQYVGEEVAKREEMIEKSKRAYAASFTKAEIVIEVPESKKALTSTTTKSINEIGPLNLRDLKVPELAVYCIVSERFGLIESFDAAREGRVKAIAKFAKQYGKSGVNLRKQMDAHRKLTNHPDNMQRLKTITPFIQHSKEAVSFVETILKVLETKHL